MDYLSCDKLHGEGRDVFIIKLTLELNSLKSTYGLYEELPRVIVQLVYPYGCRPLRAL